MKLKYLLGVLSFGAAILAFGSSVHSQGVYGQYNTTPPAVGNGASSILQLDTVGQLRIVLCNYNVNNCQTMFSMQDAQSNGSFLALAVSAFGSVYNGSTWDRLRTPATFKPLAAAAIGAEATIWTPTTGKKFRLMGYCVSQGTAAGNVVLKDNTAGTTIYTIPKTTADVASCNSLGNGILSAAANNVLTATGVATETLSGTIWGTEE